MTILIAGVDAGLADALRAAHPLEVVRDFHDFSIGDWLMEGCLYQAAVVDLESTDLGLRACREVRSRRVRIPILGLASPSIGTSWSESRATFLDSGGDDLLQKPASPTELVASLRASMRRADGAGASRVEVIADGHRVAIDTAAGLVSVDGARVDLTPKECELMGLLASKAGTVVTKEQILNGLYTLAMDQPEQKIVDVFICKLRRKLKDFTGGKDLVQTVWGRGYCLGQLSADRSVLGLGLGIGGSGITTTTDTADMSGIRAPQKVRL